MSAQPEPTVTELDPVSAVGHAFKGAMAAVRRLRGRETRWGGILSDAQYGLLFGLCDGVARSSGDLAAAADLSPAATTEMLEGLEATGLIERHRSERDRRVVLTVLTDRGLALVQERRARYEPRWRAAMSEFSEEELRATAAVLDRVRAMFDEIADE
jgi:MarR family transcriptional regulator, organic hydroperoxide resistance regulator